MLSEKNSPFTFQANSKQAPIFVRKTLDRVFQLNKLDSIYFQIESSEAHTFIKQALEVMNITIEFDYAPLENLPKDKPVLFVANHPFGGLEGLIMAHILQNGGGNFKIMANYLLQRIPEIADLFFPVDPFGGQKAKAKNYTSLRNSVKWLKAGNRLLVFPSGEVSSFKPSLQKVSDPQWQANIGKLIRITQPVIVPVFFSGHNGVLFNFMGLINKWLRTALLPRALWNKRNSTIYVKAGLPLEFSKVEHFEDDQALVDFLYSYTYLIQDDAEAKKEAANAIEYDTHVAKPVPGGQLKEEVDSLPQECFLLEQKGFAVYYAQSNQIPLMMQEIGRCREVTFRETGEGSGKALDIDIYDDYYYQLFIWDRQEKSIVGAYRLGLTDKILPRFGKKGLYTNSLFKISKKLTKMIDPAIELGRSFILKEYQKSFLPLMLLWKGIGEVVNRNPRYRYLFGPVSISRDYSDASRELIRLFLMENRTTKQWDHLAKNREGYKPFIFKGFSRKTAAKLLKLSDKTELLNDLISNVENRKEQIPILLKHYLGLNAVALAYNVDKEFSDVLDILIVVDLAKAPAKKLGKYMGKENVENFVKLHQKLMARKE
jgi:putative hemolysin